MSSMEEFSKDRVPRVVALIVGVAIISAAIGYGVSLLTSSRPDANGFRTPSTESTTSPSTTTAASNVPNVAYTSIAVVGGRLIATDPGTTSFDCTNAPVNELTLQIETKSSSPCVTNSPPVGNSGFGYLASTAGESVSPVISLDASLEHGSGSYDGLVQIARQDPQPSKSIIGPVVMTFNDEVNTYQPEDAYGAGILWIYDCETPSGSQLLEVSAVNGVVEASVTMPDICRAAVMANDEGFFLGENDESFGPGPNTLYHVAPGATRAVAVYSFTGPLEWSGTFGPDLWIEATNPGFCPQHELCQAGDLVRFVGIAATLQVISTSVEMNGYQPAPVAGNGSIWVVQATQGLSDPPSYAQSVDRINIETGAVNKVGFFGNSMPDPGAGDPSMAYLHGAMYVLEGGTVYRV